MSKLITCPFPTAINPLSPNGFKFSIQRIPEFTYFCQEVNLPDANLGVAQVATPFVDYPTPGDKMEFGDLTIQFLVDSDMSNYKAVFNWLSGLGFPENYEQYQAQVDKDYRVSPQAAVVSDATLSILSNTNNDVATVQFIDCFPVSLSSLVFTSTNQDVQYLIGNATFKYSYYRFI